MGADQIDTDEHRPTGITNHSHNGGEKIHEEDLQFHLQLVKELGGFKSESEEEEASIEISDPEIQHNLSAISIEVAKSRKPATQSPRKLTRVEVQEAKGKARAWHLDVLLLQKIVRMQGIPQAEELRQPRRLLLYNQC